MNAVCRFCRFRSWVGAVGLLRVVMRSPRLRCLRVRLLQNNLSIFLVLAMFPEILYEFLGDRWAVLHTIPNY